LNIINLIRAVTDIYPSCFFDYKNTKFNVKKAFETKNTSNISGIPGQINQVTDRYIYVFTKNGIIRLAQIYQNNVVIVNLKTIFKEGDVLNE